MARTHFSGPVASVAGFEGPIVATSLSAASSLSVGAAPVAIKQIASGSVAVNAGTLAAQTALDVSVTITGAAAGDIVQIMPLNASMEAGLAIQAVWVSAANTVKIRLFNNNAVAALAGGSQNWTYLWTDIT